VERRLAGRDLGGVQCADNVRLVRNSGRSHSRISPPLTGAGRPPGVAPGASTGTATSSTSSRASSRRGIDREGANRSYQQEVTDQTARRSVNRQPCEGGTPFEVWCERGSDSVGPPLRIPLAVAGTVRKS
jgi:hypothetical protein